MLFKSKYVSTPKDVATSLKIKLGSNVSFQKYFQANQYLCIPNVISHAQSKPNKEKENDEAMIKKHSANITRKLAQSKFITLQYTWAMIHPTWSIPCPSNVIQ